MRMVFAAVAAAVVFSSGAASTAGGETPPLITNPDWAEKPSGAVVARYYPEEAIDRTISGRATVTCVVGVNGALRDCKAVSEWPVGLGFGAAVERMALREFRMKPMLRDGKPVDGGTVRIPMVFLVGSGSRYIILDPVWARAPTFEDMAAAWPAEAGDLPEGVVALRCKLAQSGSLRDCVIAGGIPRGVMFGKAALNLTDRFQMKMSPDEATKYANSDVIISFQFYNPATPAGMAKKVVKPTWITRLDPKAIIALYPTAAADKGVTEGLGVADCAVAADGLLVDCRVAREDPAGLGFGVSAVAVAGVTRMNPWTAGGRPVQGARLKLPIRFSLASETEEAAEGTPD